MTRNRFPEILCLIAFALFTTSQPGSAAPQVGHAYTVLIPRPLIRMQTSSFSGLTVGTIVLETNVSGTTVGGQRDWRSKGLPFAQKMNVVVSKKKRIELRKGTLSLVIRLRGKWNSAEIDNAWNEVLVEGYPASSEAQRRLRHQISGYLASFSESADEEKSKANVDLLLWFTTNSQAQSATEFSHKDSRVLAVTIPEGNQYYNSLQLNKRARVASVLSKRLLPLARLSANAMSDGRELFMLATRIPYKNFLRELDLFQYDQVALIVEPSLARKFADAEITDQAFLNGSILLVDSSRTEISLLAAN